MTTKLIISFMWQYCLFNLISFLTLVMDEIYKYKNSKKAKPPNGRCGLIINEVNENCLKIHYIFIEKKIFSFV